MAVAAVYLRQTNKRLDACYDYDIPENLVKGVVPGVRVVVGFGNGDRVLEGFVVAIKDHSDYSGALKSIRWVIDEAPVLTTSQLALCQWMRDYYCSLYYEALAFFVSPVPVEHRMSEVRVEEGYQAYTVTETVYHLTEAGHQGHTTGHHMNRVIDLLRFRDYTASEMREILGDIASSRRALIQKGWVIARERCIDLEETEDKKPMGPPEALVGRAKACYLKYSAKETPEKPVFFCLRNKKSRFALYAKLIADCLKTGKQAVLLYPEVGLSLENQKDFYQFFGNRGAVCHGRLKKRERYLLYEGVRTGSIQVVMGSRAALFLPYGQLGLIIIDEEMDGSYYAASMPRFHTLRVAQEYARITGAQLVAGDALPSVQAYAAAASHSWQFIGDLSMTSKPPVVVDMQAEIRQGNLDFMSRPLEKALVENSAAGKKSLLLLNRRGYASYTFCRDCGYVPKCESCGVTLKYYQDGTLRCPYCGKTQVKSTSCPRCGSRRYRTMGLGVDQAEAVLRKRYPHWRILKIDGGTVPDYEAYKAMNETLSKGEWDVVLGTRLLIKGFAFGPVDLAAALLMDNDMNFGDYTSGEKAYQLYARFFSLSQGMALGQTYEPENETVAALASGDPPVFYRSELSYRKALGYPPAGHLAVFGVMAPDARMARVDALTLGKTLKESLGDQGTQGYTLFEPTLAGRQPGSGEIRYKLLLKLKTLAHFQSIMRGIIQDGGIERLGSRISIEIDPPVTI